VLIYTVLLVIELKLMVKAIQKGPEHESEPHLSLYEPMIKSWPAPAECKQGVHQMILHELISYDVLRLIWWLLLGVLLVGFAVTDGFDLGAWAAARHGQDRCGAPHRHQLRRPRVGRQPGVADSGRRRHLCRLAAAVRVSFSGFYLAMFAVLVPLILRPWPSSSAASARALPGATAGTGCCASPAWCQRCCSAWPWAM
jgi:hypothetical protein